MKYLFFVCCCTFFSSCFYDVEEELYGGSNECLPSNVSYNNDVVPIFQSFCYSCHNAAANFGNVTLEGHENALKSVSNGSLLGSIKHEGTFSPMPQGQSMLSDCNIKKISVWIQEGAKNN